VIVQSDLAIRLPQADGSLRRHVLSEPRAWPTPTQPLLSRIAYAAAHVVSDPLHEPDGSGRAHLDWEATLAFRRHLWSYGLGVAEAMDTAQRGSGLGWTVAQELIARSAAEAAAVGGRLVCGIGTDQLPAGPASLAQIIRAYREQGEFVASHGARVVVMASRELAAVARSAEDYVHVYDEVVADTPEPVILHWLGEMFDPALAGYWGSADLASAIDTVTEFITEHAPAIDGVKLSLLDADAEVELRRRLPDGVRLYTGDDLNYPQLISGDEVKYSDALLGVFDPIAPIASTALAALDARDARRAHDLLTSTLELARHLFATPTASYKAGIVLLAYLNGHQDHFRMVAGTEGARSVLHMAQTLVLADQAGLIADPERAAVRMRAVLAVAGIEG
jgi:hypothetical protein